MLVMFSIMCVCVCVQGGMCTRMQVPMESEKSVRSLSCVDVSVDLCRSCLLDLGPEDLKEQSGLQPNAVDNCTLASVCFHTQM